MSSCTFSDDDPSVPTKWLLDIHTLDAWLHSANENMYQLFEVQLRNTDSEGVSVIPIEITLRPRPMAANYAWPSSFDVSLSHLILLFNHVFTG